MAMTMSGEQQLAAPRETVWAKLNDPEVLKACIPGCETLEMLSATTNSRRSPPTRSVRSRRGSKARCG